MRWLMVIGLILVLDIVLLFSFWFNGELFTAWFGKKMFSRKFKALFIIISNVIILAIAALAFYL